MHLIIPDTSQYTGTLIGAANRKLEPAVLGLIITLEGRLSGICLDAPPVAAVIESTVIRVGLRALRGNANLGDVTMVSIDLARHVKDDFQCTVTLSSVLRTSKIVLFQCCGYTGLNCEAHRGEML